MSRDGEDGLRRAGTERGVEVRRKRLVGVLGMATLLLLNGGAPAGAAPEDVPAVERRPAIAMFEGRPIDLSQDWGEARACLVWRQGGVLECFRAPEALEAREARLSHERPQRPQSQSSGEVTVAAYGYSCSSSLRLYEHNHYGGRQLSFWDRGYWQNLWDYGFDDRTSSYAVGACYAHLAEHAGGWGYWYPGPTYPWAGEPVMSWSWQDRVSSIYIE